MYWWIIFWVLVVATVIGPISKSLQLADSDNALDVKLIEFIIYTGILLWFNISILRFMWLNLK